MLRALLSCALAALVAFAPQAAAAQDDDAVLAMAKNLLQQAQSGTFDRTQFSPGLDATLSDDDVAALKAQLRPLGAPSSFEAESKTGVDSSTVYVFRATFKTAVIEETLTIDADGKLAGLTFKPPE